jgi:outer membrane biosynthesis protein TonB
LIHVMETIMRRSLVLFALPLYVSLNAMAFAEAMAPEQVGQLLAKSHAINAKCNILPDDKSQELRNVLARAEISLAEKVSVEAARKAMAAGREQGKAAMCDDAARKLVNDVSTMANRAASIEVADETVAETPKPVVTEPKVEAVEEKPVDVAVAPVVKTPEPKEEKAAEPVAEKPAKPVVKEAAAPKPKAKVEKPVKKSVVKTVEKPVVKKPTAKPVKLSAPKGQNLGSYAALAERYYVARRCRTMSRGQIGALYNKVLTSHRQAMSKSRARDVQQALRAAEARADGQSCG